MKFNSILIRSVSARKDSQKTKVTYCGSYDHPTMSSMVGKVEVSTAVEMIHHLSEFDQSAFAQMVRKIGDCSVMTIPSIVGTRFE